MDLGEGTECIWPLLIQKAYAKYFGGYNKLSGGFTQDVLRDLTGAPSVTYAVDEDYLKSESPLIEIFTDAQRNQFMMTAGVRQEAHNHADRHIVSIVDVKISQKDSSYQCVLSVFDPWGAEGEDASKPEHSPTARQQRSAQRISLKTFVARYDELVVTKINYSYYYSSIEFPYKVAEEPVEESPACHPMAAVVQFSVDKKFRGYVTVSQRDARTFQFSRLPYRYSLVNAIICSTDGDYRLQELHNFSYGCSRDLSLEVSLPAGDYLLYVEVDWEQCVNNGWVVSFYSNYQITAAELVSKQEYVDVYTQNSILDQVVQKIDLKQYARMLEVKKYLNGISRYMLTLAGYLYLIYENATETYLFQEVITLCKKRNITPCKLNSRGQYVSLCSDAENAVDVFKVRSDYQCQRSIIKFKINTRDREPYAASFRFPDPKDWIVGSPKTLIMSKYSPSQLIDVSLKQQPQQKSRLNEVLFYKYEGCDDRVGNSMLLWVNNTECTYQETIKLKLQNMIQVNNLALVNNETIHIQIDPKKQFYLIFEAIDLMKPFSVSEIKMIHSSLTKLYNV